MRLIDADEIKYTDMLSSKGNGSYEHVGIVTQSEIDALPTVDAEPVRHGKFIGTEYDGYADGHPVYYEWKCSECGCIFEDDEPTYNYCPYCGAKMDGMQKKPCDDCQQFDCYGCEYAESKEE